MIDLCTFATLTDGLHGIKCIHGMASFGHEIQNVGLGLDSKICEQTPAHCHCKKIDVTVIDFA